MSDANQSFGQALVKSLVGERGHIRIARALPDIDVTLAARTHDAMPYTIYQLVKHMHYWQQFMLEHLEGRKPQLPANVSESWPEEKGPQDEATWKADIQAFLDGVDQAVAIAESAQLDDPLLYFPGETKAGLLRNIASHNSYHLGEIVLLRRFYGAWPPPGGGFPA
ncbi:DinB family protein [Paenibacillus xylanexedens]|uniref:DinB family protein n=1 Tax=Paenibacillus xylanexedens TaxID=528191 RepID=UPI001F2BBBE9|nr:DinB family protein [Paenibacillus xylanexedens]MCF7757859.1 DinB family protein [Paenibacillus xylanexedens]